MNLLISHVTQERFNKYVDIFGISYDVAKMSVGYFCVVWSGPYIVDIFIFTNKNIKNDVQNMYPSHQITTAKRGAAHEVLSLIEKSSTEISIKRFGTPFQESVWLAISHIKLGETKSYQQIANEIQKPKAVRAVASAIGGKSFCTFDSLPPYC